MAEGDRLILKRSADAVRFLHPPGYNYFATLREKLRWSEAMREAPRHGLSHAACAGGPQFTSSSRKSRLELGGGFTALTGETGAGKSILIDALELLVGGRGDGGLVREGAERAELSAEFEVERKSAPC